MHQITLSFYDFIIDKAHSRIVFLIVLYFSLLTTCQASKPEFEVEKEVFSRPRLEVLPSIALNSFNDFYPNLLMNRGGTKIICVDIDLTIIQNKLHILNFSDENQAEILNTFRINWEYNISDDDFNLLKAYIKETNNFYSPFSKLNGGILIEPVTPNVLSNWKNEGAVIIGVTARKYNIADDTDKSLKALGINFAELSGFGSLVLEEELFQFKNGICYTNNKIRKLYVIPWLLALVEQHQKKIGPYITFHFDDSKVEIGEFQPENPPMNPTSVPVSIQPVFYRGFVFFNKSKFENLDDTYQEIVDHFLDDGFTNWFKTVHRKTICIEIHDDSL